MQRLKDELPDDKQLKDWIEQALKFVKVLPAK
jgi:hypothetical protein